MRKKILYIAAAAVCLLALAVCVIPSIVASVNKKEQIPVSDYTTDAGTVPDYIMPAQTEEAAPQRLSSEAGETGEPAVVQTSAATKAASSAESAAPQESSTAAQETEASSATAAVSSAAPSAESTESTAASADTTPVSASTAAEATTVLTVSPAGTAEVEPADEETDTNILLTTNDPTRQIRFEFTGGGISFSGRYSGDSVSSVFIHGSRVECKDLSISGDSFEGSMDTSSLKDGYYVIAVRLNGGSTMNYVFEVKNGSCGKLPTDELPYEDNLRATETPLELSKQGVLSYITTSGDSERASEILAQVKELSDTVCFGITDDYAKARALAEWVSLNTYYDSDAAANGVTEEEVTLEFVLEYHRSVCFGWTNLYAAMCQAQGIECYVASGSSVNGSRCFLQTETADERSHSWNMVRIDGRDIWVDTVWCSTNSYENGSYNKGVVDYQFFDINAELLSYDHRVTRFESREYF